MKNTFCGNLNINDELANMNLHHSALTKGYQTVKCNTAVEYTGRFGTGYAVYGNNPRSNRYMIVSYYVR